MIMAVYSSPLYQETLEGTLRKFMKDIIAFCHSSQSWRDRGRGGPGSHISGTL